MRRTYLLATLLLVVGIALGYLAGYQWAASTTGTTTVTVTSTATETSTTTVTHTVTSTYTTTTTSTTTITVTTGKPSGGAATPSQATSTTQNLSLSRVLEEQVSPGIRSDVAKYTTLTLKLVELMGSQPAIEMVPLYREVATLVATTATPAPVVAQVVEVGKTPSAPSYSTTNIQVAGVDEPDYVKTDGERIFVASRDKVYVVKAYPPEGMRIAGVIDALADAEKILPAKGNITITVGSEVVAVIPFKPSIYIKGIHVAGDRLIILALAVYKPSYAPTVRTAWIPPPWIPVWWQEEYTVVLVYDTKSLKLLDSFWVEGAPLTSRLTGSLLVIVSSHSPLVWVQPLKPIKPLVTASTSWGNYPVIVSALPATHKVVVVGYDVEKKTHSVLALLSPAPRFILVTPDKRLYMVSPIYAVYRIQPLIRIVESVPPEKLPEAIKANITKIILPPPSDGLTLIQHIKFDGVKPILRATILLTGRATAQLAIDVHEGVLRVALQRGWGNGFNIYTLDADSLEVLGKLEKVLERERVHAVRFIGDRLYLVTYRNVDPLFVIDLSDPHHPRILGYRKGPGFDEYLHPYNSTILIGVGYTDKRYVRVSVYRVEEDGSVTLLDKLVLPSRWTPVTSATEWGYHAFLLDTQHNLILVPVTMYKKEKPRSIMVYYAIPFNPTTMKLGRPVELEAGGLPWARALYIDDVVYTVSSTVVHAYKLPGFEHVAGIELRG